MSISEATSREEVATTADIKVLDLGIVAEHNMPCCVYQDHHAVLHMNTGIFHPSRRAQYEGYRLVRVQNTKLARFLVKHLSKYMFGDNGHV